MSHETRSPRSEIRWTTPDSAQPAGSVDGTPALSRFLGGSPVAVFVRLFFVSLIVGALLMWLDIRPYEVFRAVERLFARLWALGFDALHEIVTYVIAGAAIVIPVWFVLRLFNMRGAR